MIRRLQELPASQFLITFWVAPTVNRDVLQAYFRALKRTDEALARDPEQYASVGAQRSACLERNV